MYLLLELDLYDMTLPGTLKKKFDSEYYTTLHLNQIQISASSSTNKSVGELGGPRGEILPGDRERHSHYSAPVIARQYIQIQISASSSTSQCQVFNEARCSGCLVKLVCLVSTSVNIQDVFLLIAGSREYAIYIV